MIAIDMHRNWVAELWNSKYTTTVGCTRPDRRIVIHNLKVYVHLRETLCPMGFIPKGKPKSDVSRIDSDLANLHTTTSLPS